MEYKFTLKEKQSIVHLCDKRFRVINAGRRFGKTWLAGAEILQFACSLKAAERGDFNVWYIAPVADQARNLMWDGWLKKYVPSEWIAYKNEQRMVMQLRNGTTISIFSAEKPDHLVGTYIDFLVMDECALINESVYNLVRPSLSDKQGHAMFISTPRGYNWFYDLYMKSITDPEEWASFEFTTLEGGNVPQEEIENAKRDLPLKLFQQEYLASFECVADRVYDSYDKQLNLCDLNPTWGLADIHVGMDFNVNPMTATVSVIENDRELGEIAYTFDEFYLHDSNTDRLAKEIRNKYPFADIYVYPDPTGKKRQSSAPVGQTDFTILENNGFHVCAPYAPYTTRDKVNTVNHAFCDAAGNRRAFIARGTCPNLRKALEGYAYKENGDMDKSGGLDHISDAFAYFINYKMPINGNTPRYYKPQVYGV